MKINRTLLSGIAIVGIATSGNALAKNLFPVRSGTYTGAWHAINQYTPLPTAQIGKKIVVNALGTTVTYHLDGVKTTTKVQNFGSGYTGQGYLITPANPVGSYYTIDVSGNGGKKLSVSFSDNANNGDAIFRTKSFSPR
jgi:hypothetical protein